MVDMIRETYKRNGAKTILDGDKRIWVNEKYIEERLHNTLLKIWNLPIIAKKHLLEYRQAFLNKESISLKKLNKLFLNKELATEVILDCTTTAANKFGTWLAFKLDVIKF